MEKIKLVVFDMAGTTVSDKNEVEKCFVEAADSTGLAYSVEEIISMMGWSKRLVFETLWKKNLPAGDEDLIRQKTDQSYQRFKVVLENHYRTQPVLPSVGTPELFGFLKSEGIKIALTTGFYREVTDIILNRLGWDAGLNADYVGDTTSVIDVSVASDQVKVGRPAPDMILRAMQLLGVSNPAEVINIGDTPSDLQSGKNAGCLLSLGVTNGTHTREQLSVIENDGLLNNISELRWIIENLGK
jgi:phosphonatase-like hydrolase